MNWHFHSGGSSLEQSHSLLAKLQLWNLAYGLSGLPDVTKVYRRALLGPPTRSKHKQTWCRPSDEYRPNCSVCAHHCNITEKNVPASILGKAAGIKRDLDECQTYVRTKIDLPEVIPALEVVGIDILPVLIDSSSIIVAEPISFREAEGNARNAADRLIL
jgi:hypothetical protein